MSVIVSMFQLKLSIKKLTTLESQHQHMHHTVIVSFGAGVLKLGYSNKIARRISLHEGLCQLDSHTELPRSQRMIPPTAAQSCTDLSHFWQAVGLNEDVI